MNKHQIAIKSTVRSFDMISVLIGSKIPSNYLIRRKVIKEVLKERGISLTEDILLTRNKLKKLITCIQEEIT